MVNDEIYAALTPQIIIFSYLKKIMLHCYNVCVAKTSKREKKQKICFCLVILAFEENHIIETVNLFMLSIWF